MFACTRQGGSGFAFPDVCNTPMPPPVGTAPIPYPNTAECAQAKARTVSDKVVLVSKPALTDKSVIAQTSGDEPGTQNGIMSGTVRSQAAFAKGSVKVFIEGNAAVRLGDPTRHNGNNANAPGGTLLTPGQTKVMIMS